MAGTGFTVAAIGDGTKLSVGRGRLFIDRLSTAGAKTGATFCGTVDALGITPSADFAEKRTMVDATNALLSRIETSRTLELNITAAEWKKELLAMALLGNVAEYTQTATPVVDETITTSSLKDRWYWPLSGKRKLTSYTLKVSPSTAKTEGTDYEIDAETGGVYIKPTGSIADASTLLLSYTPTLISAGSGLTQVNVGAAGTILAEVRFVADPLTGNIHEVLLYRVQFSSQEVIAFLGQEYGTFGLKGTPLVSATPTYTGTTYGVVFQR